MLSKFSAYCDSVTREQIVDVSELVSELSIVHKEASS